MEMSRWLRKNMQTSAWPLDRCCHITVPLWNQQLQYASGQKHASQRADELAQSLHLALQPVLPSRPSIGTKHLRVEQLKELGHPSGWAQDGPCSLLLYQSQLNNVSQQGAIFVSTMGSLMWASAGFRPNPFLGTIQRELRGYFLLSLRLSSPAPDCSTQTVVSACGQTALCSLNQPGSLPKLQMQPVRIWLQTIWWILCGCWRQEKPRKWNICLSVALFPEVFNTNPSLL